MDSPQKTQIIVEASFVHPSAPEFNSNLTVFERVFNKLVSEGRSLGKIQPIYLKIVDFYVVLGVLTLNKSGSYSLFLELPGLPPFDHITFVKNLVKNNHHFSGFTDKGREKLLPLSAELLSNGTYHALTLIAGKTSFFKEASKKVAYPEVDIQHLKVLEEAFITKGAPEGSTIIDIRDNEGLLCIQFFLIPKEVDYKLMNFFIEPLKEYIPTLDLRLENGSPEYKGVIPHEYQDDYVIGINALLLKKHSNPDLFVLSTARPKGHYSKIDIQHRTSKRQENKL
jgi:hypothetical protein